MQKKKTCGNFLFLCSILTLCFVSPVYANEVATKIESLSDFLLQIVQAAGVIVMINPEKPKSYDQKYVAKE